MNCGQSYLRHTRLPAPPDGSGERAACGADTNLRIIWMGSHVDRSLGGEGLKRSRQERIVVAECEDRATLECVVEQNSQTGLEAKKMGRGGGGQPRRATRA